MKRILPFILLIGLIASCAPVDLNAPMPACDTGVDPNAWASIPAGEFTIGQHEDIEAKDAYQIMVTDVTASQYAEFLNAALVDGYVKLDGDQVLGYYPGDPFHGEKHEEEIKAGTGVQTGSAARWGDYSMMSVDPVDDTTFWFTTEYVTLPSRFPRRSLTHTRPGRL